MRRGIACLILLAGTLASAPTEAQITERLRLHLEAGAGSMLSEVQLDDLDYGLTVLGAARVGFEVIEPLSIQASFAYWWFPSDAGDGEQLSFSGGLRLAPRIGDVGRFFVDANAGLGRTGDKSRFALDAGAGFQFSFARDAIALGPFVRYGHLFATDQDHPSDAQYLVAGLAGSFGVPATVELRSVSLDTDGDGVLDADDLCVDVPAGDSPDPERRGCPLGDGDGDGVNDRDDVCPTEPQGEHPDPERAGCPASDADGDGVFDHDDPCPTTPAGEHPDPNRAGCPDADTDGDSVWDSADQCPEEHRGLNPDPERPGCPLPDRDRDSVPDASDACPDEPGAPSRDPARNGCPGLVIVEEGQLRIMQPVYFATNRDRILARSRSVLEAVADAIAATPAIRRVSIEGHTDDVGDDAYNLDLSRRRANNVRDRLIEYGIDASRLESHGYGETCPKVAATTRSARAENRRVMFRIIDPPISPPNECPEPEPAPETEE